MANYKPYTYKKRMDPVLDAEFAAAPVYGKVKPGATAIFWKFGLRWYAISLREVQRIFRRVEPVYGKLCCGGRSFIIEWLVLILGDGSELVIHIGDDEKEKAQALLAFLQERHPEIPYGKG